MRLIAIIFFLFFFSHFSRAQNVEIIGSAMDFKSEIIKLQIQADPITGHYITVARDTISSDGQFALKYDISKITYAKIKIGIVNLSLFMEPGQKYSIKVPMKKDLVDEGVEQRFNSFIPIEEAADIVSPDTNSVNFKISAFNELYNNFIIIHQQELKFKRNRALVNELKKTVDNRFHRTVGYFKDYIECRFASLEMMEQLKSNKDIVDTYFKQRAPLYNNSEYIDFFNEFYSGSFQKLKRMGFRDTLRYAINIEKSYISLIKIVASDSTLLPNDTLRELVTIKGLYEIYTDPDFSKEGILSVLDFIARMSNIKEDQVIATSIIRELKRLEPSSVAPVFTLNDIDGKSHCLIEYQGKMVFLNFWASYNVPSIEEYRACDTLRNKFGDKLVVLNISIDRTVDGLKEVMKAYRLKSGTLHYGLYKDILDDYSISGIPSFVLIDEQGRIINAQAMRPSEGALAYIDSIFVQREFDKQKKTDAEKRQKTKKRVDDINNSKKNKRK